MQNAVGDQVIGRKFAAALYFRERDRKLYFPRHIYNVRVVKAPELDTP